MPNFGAKTKLYPDQKTMVIFNDRGGEIAKHLALAGHRVVSQHSANDDVEISIFKESNGLIVKSGPTVKDTAFFLQSFLGEDEFVDSMYLGKMNEEDYQTLVDQGTLSLARVVTREP